MDWLCQHMNIPSFLNACPSSEAVALDRAFKFALSVLDVELKDLVFRSMELIGVLDEIDEQLRTILSLVRAEEADILFERDVLQSLFWTSLGFNKRQLFHFDRTAKALANVGSYTALARQFVANTHSGLHDMQGDIDQLRKAGVSGTLGRWLTLEEATLLVKDGVARLENALWLRRKKRRGAGDIGDEFAEDRNHDHPALV